MRESNENPENCAPAGAHIEASGGLTPAQDGTLLTRAQTAHVLNVSASTVRRMEGTTLRPVVGPDGVHRFHEEHVREVVTKRVRSAPAAPEAYDGATAAAVFEMLDDGVPAADVVKRTKLHPAAVRAMQEEWVTLRGGFTVDAPTARAISALPWLTTGSLFRDGAELLAALRREGPRPCSECSDNRASLCAACAKSAKVHELARRAAQERAERMEREEAQATLEMDKALWARLGRKPKV
jgi:hypothetical protein